MEHSLRFVCWLLVSIALPLRSAFVLADEPLLRELPVGVVVERSVEVDAGQREAIAAKLGGAMQRLTNSVVRVQGRSIQVNVITATDHANADLIHTALAKSKPAPFCVRKGKLVVEYVGRQIDAALAIKTSYELGLRPRPQTMRYRVTAELATIDQADYMKCNVLFNQFLALQTGAQPQARQQIQTLSKAFTFGQSLRLRDPALGNDTRYQLRPEPTRSAVAGGTITYSFTGLTDKQGVPFVNATIEVTVGDDGFTADAGAQVENYLAATSFWPSEDPQIIALAERITAGKSTDQEKVAAILQWLSPGQHLRYSGKTGSRWGTRKVFEQKFGHCWDFSDCFVTLARAAGVPSRQVAGWLFGSRGHVWAEFYVPGKGWQQVDPTGGGQLNCGIYHLPYFTSDDGQMPIVYLSLPDIEWVAEAAP